MAAKKKNNPEVEETVEEVVEEVTEETVEECEAADEACNEQDEKDAAIEALNDRYRRLLAEFDNYKKRTEKEKSMMYEFIGIQHGVVTKGLILADKHDKKHSRKRECESQHQRIPFEIRFAAQVHEVSP